MSKYLTDTFGKGFSEANLKSMRSFYIAYPEFDRQCLTNLSWSNVARIIRIDNPEERNYYLNEAASQNWSYRQLERNIKSGYYHKYNGKWGIIDKHGQSIKYNLSNVKELRIT
ncbi:hypothetical protein IJ818_00060 [bacterium]|nr:hypothetical protein [bacterium]